MRENLSLLSYWGLILTLIAVTLFVVVYIYMSNPGKGEERDMVEYYADAQWPSIWQQHRVQMKIFQVNSERPLMK